MSITERLRWQVNVTRMNTAQETITDCALMMQAADVLDAIDALHQPYYDTDPDSFTIGYRFCMCGCEDPWPACPTHLLIHPEDTPS